MEELLFFVLGLVIGGLTMTVVMCLIHIKRINEMQIEYKKLEDKYKEITDEE